MILVTGLDGLLSAVDLYLLIGNLIAIGFGGLFIFTMFVSNAIGIGDQEAQKRRMDSAKRSAKYIVLSLVVIDIIFGVIHLLDLDNAADSSNSTVSEFLQKGVDNIDSGNYKMRMGENSNTDYKNSNGGDALNFGE